MSDPDLMAAFLTESADHLATVEEDILALERGTCDAATINHLFRSLHTVKGASSLLNLPRITDLSHALENVVGRARAGTLVVDEAAVNALLRGVDKLKALLVDIHDPSLDIHDEVADLQRVLAGHSDSPCDDETQPAQPLSVAGATGDGGLLAAFHRDASDRLAAIEALLQQLQQPGAPEPSPDDLQQLFVNAHGLRVGATLVDATDVARTAERMELAADRARRGQLPMHEALLAVLRSSIEALQSSLHTGSVPADTLADLAADFRSLLGDDCEPTTSPRSTEGSAPPHPVAPSTRTDAGEADFTAAAASPAQRNATTHELSTGGSSTANPLPSGSRDHTRASAPPRRTPSSAAPRTPARSSSSSATESAVRIPVALLDKLMNLATELVLVRNQNMQAAEANDRQQISAVAQRLNVVTSDLQATIMRTRMRPVGSVFNPFSRVVRDLAKKLGKEVALEVTGADVELDKNIIELIRDPLTHLVRNAIDHGIEPPQRRVGLHKAPRGRLILSAAHHADQVHIRVSDDGGGMDPATLRRAAVDKGLIDAEQAETMSDRDAYNLIFRPGFSMSDEVTDVSGRGVGMDVVKDAFRKLGGVVEVHSVVDEGSTITIKLPLTLAIIPALVLEVGDVLLAIPQVNIVEVVWVQGERARGCLERVDDQEVYALRGRLLPVLQLGKLLAIADDKPTGPAAQSQTAGDADDVTIVVLKLGEQRFGVLVDRVIDTEEIVVKPLHDMLRTCGVFAGTTVLGDGRVAMILDVGSLAELSALQLGKDEPAKRRATSSSSDDQQTVLLFDNGGPEVFAVPLCVVSRVEEVPAHRVHVAGGKEYLQYRNEIIPLVRLHRADTAFASAPDEELLYVIVPKCARPIGVVAQNILDTVEVGVHLDSQTVVRPGVVGTAVVAGRMTLFVDLFELIERAEPGWLCRARPDGRSRRRVLLLEDSAFYSAVLVPQLHGAGFEVIHARNGQEGLARLGEEAFDLVISDIEMPVMDGLQFAEHVRALPEHESLPLVALSTLPAETIEARAIGAGFDSFHPKNDYGSLFETLRTDDPAATSPKGPER